MDTAVFGSGHTFVVYNISLSSVISLGFHFLTPSSKMAPFASCLTLAGFICQFVGLRALHWSATIITLAITCIMAGARALVRRGFASDAFCVLLPKSHEVAWTALFIEHMFTGTSISDIGRLKWSVEELAAGRKAFIPHFEVVTGAYLEDALSESPGDVLFPAAVAVCRADLRAAPSVDPKLELTMDFQKLMPALPSLDRLRDAAGQLVDALEYIVRTFEGQPSIIGHDNSPLSGLNLNATIYVTRYSAPKNHSASDEFPSSYGLGSLSPFIYGYRHAFDDDHGSRTEEFESQMRALISLWVTSVSERRKQFSRKFDP